MPEEKNDKKKKKSPIAAIWESMTKTGGCCGPGETCGGTGKKDTNQENKEANKKK